LTSDILEKAQKMLEEYPLCGHCLGRQFALLGHGVENEKRGDALKLMLTMKAHQQTLSGDKNGPTLLKTLAANGDFHIANDVLKKTGHKSAEPRSCYLCNGELESTERLVKAALTKLRDYEYKTFLVGIELPPEVEEREDEFKGKFTIEHGESLRNEFSRVIGKRIAEATRKETEYERPELVVLLNPFSKDLRLQVNPIFINGRYRKLSRGIPQSRWLCGKCRGKGCKQCGGTGRMYPDSVEETIGCPALEMSQGEDIALHGAGREDIDARMLGRGRPFVIEVKKPKKRFLNLKTLRKRINDKAQGKVEVSSLSFTNKDLVRRLKKSEAAQKLYRVTVEVDEPVSRRQLTMLRKALVGTTIKQQTPQRVMHRRADMMREKYIYKANVRRLTPNRFEMRIKCQGGLYIKELVHGDQGRTKPSVSEILGTAAVPSELDVLGVYMEEET